MYPSSHTDTHSADIPVNTLCHSSIQVLKHIIRTSNELRTYSRSSESSQSSTPSAFPSISLSLPTPIPITPRLLQTGLDHHTAEQISSLFMRKAEELSKVVESSVRKACGKLVPHISHSQDVNNLKNRLCKAYTEIYVRSLDEWTEEAVLSAENAVREQQSTKSCSKQAKSQFNHVNLFFVFGILR